MATYDPKWGSSIASIESGGSDDPYTLMGPATASGDRAHGKYQVMGANIPEWTKAALGEEYTPAEFLDDPEAQDKVFKHRFSSYVDKYGSPQDAASAWFTGRPVNDASSSAQDVLGTSGADYVSKFNKGMGIEPNTAMQTAMGRSTGSKAMAYNEPGALTPQQPTGALTDGGTGVPTDKYEWLKQLGQTLTEMAPGIAQDPDHAKALEAVAAGGRKVAAAGTWSTNYDPRTGMATQTNSLDPTKTRQFKYAAPKEEKDPVQQAADIGRVKAFQDYGDEVAKNGAASRTALDTVGPIQDALSNPNVPQGTLGETRHAANKASLLVPGFDTPELRKTVADTDVAVSGINKMVQEGRTLNGGMPGSLSDKDIVFLKQSQASLANTPEANQRILEIYKKLHSRRIELDDARQAYVDDKEAHPLGLDNGFKKQINDKWAAENAARDKALTTAEATAPKKSLDMITPNKVQWRRN